MTRERENVPLVTSGESSYDGQIEMSIQEILDKASFNRIDVIYIVALGLVAMADSMQACYIAIVIPELTCIWSLSASQQSLVTSLTFMGTGTGGIFIGPLSDRFGRKPAAITTSTILFLSMTLSAISPNFDTFLVFSIVSGVCIGGSLTIAFTYWTEISSASYRKCGTTIITMFWNSGIMTVYGIAFFFLNNIGWRKFTFGIAVPALLPAVILMFLPESPKFLNSIGNVEGTKAALRTKLRDNSEINLNEIKIRKELGTRGRKKKSIKQSFQMIFSEELRCSTLKIIGIYSFLQIAFKGVLYIITAIFATNMCGSDHKVWGSNPSEKLAFGQEVECATLDDSDLINGTLLSLSFHVSSILTIILVKKFGEYWSLRFLSIAGLLFSIPMMFCLPGNIQIISVGVMGVGISGVSLVFYMVLPQIYPTIARNSGFGLVDGVGKIVASLAVFAITTIINYSLRAAIGFLIGIMVVLLVQVMLLGTVEETNDDESEITESEDGIHQD